ncbi:hypothetical protein [Brucella anthropi]|uniref:hypothetical protein n=1 Tax=Brucella anthropi TaxID=529 RepID=UPI003985974C
MTGIDNRDTGTLAPAPHRPNTHENTRTELQLMKDFQPYFDLERGLYSAFGKIAMRLSIDIRTCHRSSDAIKAMEGYG